MSPSRVSRSLAWMVVAVAAVFIPWGTLLISSAGRIDREVNAKCSGIRSLERIERYARGLSGPLPASDAEGDRAQCAKWMEDVGALAADEPELREAEASVRSAVASLESRKTESDAIATLTSLTSLIGGVDRIQTQLRTDLAILTRRLNSNWTQLNFMAILSCALAVTLALVLFAYDRSVLDRKKVEADEATLRAELAHVGRLSVVGEMGTKVAHELNQPLGAITSYLAGCVRRLQQGEGDPAEMIKALKAAAEEAKRASSIIQGLRDFVRHSQPSAAAVEINDLVREVLPLLALELRESHVVPELELTDGLETILVDRIQIGQVVVNLVRNALEAMSETPAAERRLIVRTARAESLAPGRERHPGREREPAILVSVEDTGSGVDPNLLPNLFQPFHTTKAKGMGMGLAISRTIVEAHDGWIRAEPRRGQGTVFRFQIPCPALVPA
jgi:signal transduction histidine kinase